MGTTPSKMEPGPPEVVERIVGFLIPPACREHVLGDLCERYVSPRQYVWDAARTVPLVVASRIRRTSDARLLLAQVCGLYLSFLTGAWAYEPQFFTQDWALLRLAVPSVVALFVLILRDAYKKPEEPTLHIAVAEVALALAIAHLWESLLAATNPELAVERRALAAGTGTSLLLVSWLRVFLRPPSRILQQVTSGGGSVMSPEEIGKRLLALRRQMRRRILNLSTGVPVMVVLGVIAVKNEATADRSAGAVILAAAAYVAYRLHRENGADAAFRHEGTAPSIEGYLIELEHYRDALRSIWWWYVMPYLAALLAFAFRLPLAHTGQPGSWTKLIPFVVLTIFWSLAMVERSRRSAGQVQQDIDDLNSFGR